jgi:antitoxin component YwqK of YwqJK toxin-antitoxin module
MMKKNLIVATSLLTLVSCQSGNYVSYNEPMPRPCEVVDETYVHKYGFEVQPDEWKNRGGHGQKITMLNNGVKCIEKYSFGVLEGETTYSFPYSSAVERAEVYTNGNLISEESRYLGGNPKRRVEYLMPGVEKVTLWYESGVPEAVEEYNEKSLVRGEYYNAHHTLETQVVGGNGTRTNRSASGELLSRDTIENGDMIERISYFPNGTPKEMLPYRNNIVHGLRRTFLEGGEPKTIEEWQNGVQTGLTVVYQNGEKYAEIPYRGGLKHGIERRYVDGKDLFEEVTWVDGLESGQARTFRRQKSSR